MEASDVEDWPEDMVKEYLYKARKEVEWITNEMKRLDLHMRNAKYLKSIGNRISFGYWPTKRVA